jgi:hypothetical protein
MYLCGGKWYGNAVRIADYAQALNQMADHYAKWTTPTDCRLEETDDPPNYTYEGGRLLPIETPTPTRPDERD